LTETKATVVVVIDTKRCSRSGYAYKMCITLTGLDVYSTYNQ